MNAAATPPRARLGGPSWPPSSMGARPVSDIPELALSIRQPWAWAIIHAGKDMENRTGYALRHIKDQLPCRVAIHASAGVTRQEWHDAWAFMGVLGIETPRPGDMHLGGIIGSAYVSGVLSGRGKSRSTPNRWFQGPHALTLSEVEPCEFISAKGERGLFKWQPSADLVEPPKWMGRGDGVSGAGDEPDLFSMA